MTSPSGRPVVAAVDLSCSGLVVATPATVAVLDPVVAPVSALGPGDGAGARVECSERVERLRATEPGWCVDDPWVHVDGPRVGWAGVSVTTEEVLAAPVARALRHVGHPVPSEVVGPGAPGVVLVVPSHWGRTRLRRLLSAVSPPGAPGSAVPVRTVRAALATVEALSAGAARWVVCTEGMSDGVVCTLVLRERAELRVVDRRFVPTLDPVERATGPLPRRVVAEVMALRADNRQARTGSFEVLARGLGAEQVVDECDRRRVLSHLVVPEAAAEAAVRL